MRVAGRAMELEVWLDRRLMGNLSHEGATNRFAFRYTPDWLAEPRRYPLSPRIPLERPAGQSDEQHSAEVRQFFENLLPEGDALDHAAQTNGVSKANLVALLIALGRETSGALRIALPGSASSAANGAEHERRLLTPDELSQRIRERAQQPFSVWDGRVRLSIAGYQDKIAVFEDGGLWYLVDGPNLASTFIVKPAPVGAPLATLPYNEYFCMRLAARVGLPAAEVQLHHVPEPVLFVRRFDRTQPGDGTVRRLHVIDGCQALGLPVGMKYERAYGDRPEVMHLRDGASLPMLFGLMAHSPQPLVDRRTLVRWVIFQVLIGNSDAHGKNISFYCGVDGLRVAPAYDLVCMPPLGYTHPMAMAIGDAFTEAALTPFEWASFAAACGVTPRSLAQEMQQMGANMQAALPALADELAGDVPASVSAAIRATAEPACQRLLDQSQEVPKVKPKYL